MSFIAPAPKSLFSINVANLERGFGALAISQKQQIPGKKGPIESSLESYSQGFAVEEQIQHIASVLFNQEKSKFHQYTPREQQAFILLLLCYWDKTGKVMYLDLLHYTLPYCLDHVDAICPHSLVVARAKSPRDFALALDHTVKIFLAKQNSDYVSDDVGCQNCTQLLKHTPLTNDSDFIADALSEWRNASQPKLQQMVAAIDFFVDFKSSIKANPEDREEIVCELICRLLENTNDANFCLDVLFSLLCKDTTITDIQWSQTLKNGHVLSLFVKIINNANFPSYKREAFMKAYVHLQAPVNSMALAARLIRSTSILDAKTLFVKLNWCIKKKQRHPPLGLFMRKLAKASDEKIAKLLPVFVNLMPLMKKLEREVRENDDHPGRDFLFDCTRIEDFTQESRNSLFQVWLNEGSPARCLIYAALILKPEEIGLIHHITNKLLDRLTQNLSCPHLEYFCSYVRTEQLDPKIKNTIITYLLQKNTPSALWFVTKLCGALPVSAVWLLLKKIERCSPLDEQAKVVQKKAFTCLLDSIWYSDPRKNFVGQTWYKNRQIVFYTLHDDAVHDLHDKLQAVSQILGVSNENTSDGVHSKIVDTVVADRKRFIERPKRREPPLRKKVLCLDHLTFLRAKAGEDFPRLAMQAPLQQEAFAEIPRPDSPELTDEN